MPKNPSDPSNLSISTPFSPISINKSSPWKQPSKLSNLKITFLKNLSILSLSKIRNLTPGSLSLMENSQVYKHLLMRPETTQLNLSMKLSIWSKNNHRLTRKLKPKILNSISLSPESNSKNPCSKKNSDNIPPPLKQFPLFNWDSMNLNHNFHWNILHWKHLKMNWTGKNDKLKKKSNVPHHIFVILKLVSRQSNSMSQSYRTWGCK